MLHMSMGLLDLIKRRLRGPEKPAPTSANPAETRVDAKSVFRMRVMQSAMELDSVVKIERADDDFGLRIWLQGREGHCQAHLGNLFEETRHLRAPEIHAAIDGYVRMFAENIGDAQNHANELDQLMSVVRVATMFVSNEHDLPGLRREILPCVCESLVVDAEHSMRYVTRADLERWAIEPSEAYARGRARVAEIESTFVRHPEAQTEIWCVAQDDDYQSSRLLDPELLEDAQRQIGGKLAFAIPHRAALWAARVDDPDALRELLSESEEEYEQSTRAISPCLYELDQGVVRRLRLPDAHPLEVALAQSCLQFEAGEYNLQKSRIDAWHQREGREIFVAQAAGLETGDGQCYSYCVWTEGVESLLPHTDLVALQPAPDGGEDGGEAPKALFVTASDLLEIAGQCLKHLPSPQPLRYLTERWPDEATLEALAAREIRLEP